MEYYSPREERLNIVSHAFGLLLSVIGLVLLEIHAVANGDVIHIIGLGIFGSSLVLLYAASTLYHGAKKESTRKKLRILDHAAIYVLIAGSYTPFTLITMNGNTGALLFCISWGLALVGVTMKIFFTGKYKLLSTIMYVLIGSIIFIDVDPLVSNIHANGLNWLLGGGLSYLFGAIIYSIKVIKYNHAIFHIFVLGGSFCHFIAAYFYIIP